MEKQQVYEKFIIDDLNIFANEFDKKGYSLQGYYWIMRV